MQIQELQAAAIGAAEEGRYRDAIALLSAEQSIDLDPEVERQRVTWRIAAFHETNALGKGPDAWPPTVVDSFPHCTGLPEIQAGDLDSAILAGAILHHGGLLVRGLVSTRATEKFREGIDQAIHDFARWSRDPRIGPTPWFAPAMLEEGPVAEGRPWLLNAGGVYGGDSPRLLCELIGLLRTSGIEQMVTEYLGEAPALSVGKSTFRRVSASLDNTAWHQDGAFLGRDVRSVNLWVALSSCGRNASAIDLVPRRMQEIVETGTHDAQLSWCVGHEKVLEILQGDPVVSPEFEAGDALLFDHMFLHRTSLPPGRTEDRWAIEAWMFAPSRYPMQQVPIIL
jgi:hypothetical protein